MSVGVGLECWTALRGRERREEQAPARSGAAVAVQIGLAVMTAALPLPELQRAAGGRARANSSLAMTLYASRCCSELTCLFIFKSNFNLLPLPD